jgi:hypothetical protein
MDDQIIPIDLTAHEIVFLTDNIQVGDTNVGDPDHPHTPEPIARALLLKLGNVFLQVMSPTGVQENESRGVSLTENECWLIKSRVRVGDLGLSGKPVGATILLKVVTALVQFNPDKPGIAPAVILDGVPVAEESDDDSYRAATRKAKAREKEERRSAWAANNPDHSANNNPGTGKGEEDPPRPDLPGSEGQDHPDH